MLFIPPARKTRAMPDPMAFAYPLLLASTYGVYRVGQREPLARADPFEWTRLAVLAMLLGTLGALQVRMAETGLLTGNWRIFSALSSLSAVFGLVCLHVLRMAEPWRNRPFPLRN